MLGTADFIAVRIGGRSSAFLEYADQFAELAADPAATEQAVQQLTQFDERLVPYAQAALEQVAIEQARTDT